MGGYRKRSAAVAGRCLGLRGDDNKNPQYERGAEFSYIQGFNIHRVTGQCAEANAPRGSTIDR